MSEELKTALTCAVDAGKKILEIYQKQEIAVEDKVEDGRVSPLTEADTLANEIIMKALKKFDYPILSEEEKDNGDRLNHGLIWIVDPLDGTKEFIRKLNEFTVNIALVNQAEPVIGVIYVPVSGELYYAVKGEGAYHVNDQKEKIHVSDVSDFQVMTLAASRSHPSDRLLRVIKHIGFKNIENLGSSLKGCLVAEGGADCYIRLGPVSEWDICAMDLIVKEAGGMITDLKGKPLYYNKRNVLVENGFLASNSKAHEKLLESINLI